jgi:hypothetical protein
MRPLVRSMASDVPADKSLGPPGADQLRLWWRLLQRRRDRATAFLPLSKIPLDIGSPPFTWLRFSRSVARTPELGRGVGTGQPAVRSPGAPSPRQTDLLSRGQPSPGTNAFQPDRTCWPARCTIGRGCGMVATGDPSSSRFSSEASAGRLQRPSNSAPCSIASDMW